MDMNKPFERMRVEELREAIQSGVLSKTAKAKAQRLLTERTESADRLIRTHRKERLKQGEARKKTLDERKRQQLEKQREKFRGMDQRTIKNSVKNGFGLGGISAGAWTLDEGLEVYDELQQRGLIPGDPLNSFIAIMHHLQFSDTAIVYISAAFIIGFILTMGYKVLKHMDKAL